MASWRRYRNRRQPFAVEELLDEEARRYLQCPEQMLKSDPTNGEEFEPYWDALLRRDDRMYKKFIRMLHKAGYLVYTERPKGHCGVCFVHKSDGQKIRMIIDARGTNMMFDAPPGVDLLTSDGFSRIEIHVPGNLQPGTAEFDR